MPSPGIFTVYFDELCGTIIGLYLYESRRAALQDVAGPVLCRCTVNTFESKFHA